MGLESLTISVRGLRYRARLDLKNQSRVFATIISLSRIADTPFERASECLLDFLQGGQAGKLAGNSIVASYVKLKHRCLAILFPTINGSLLDKNSLHGCPGYQFPC